MDGPCTMGIHSEFQSNVSVFLLSFWRDLTISNCGDQSLKLLYYLAGNDGSVAYLFCWAILMITTATYVKNSYNITLHPLAQKLSKQFAYLHR